MSACNVNRDKREERLCFKEKQTKNGSIKAYKSRELRFTSEDE